MELVTINVDSWSNYTHITCDHNMTAFAYARFFYDASCYTTSFFTEVIMYPCIIVTWLLQFSLIFDGIDVMDDSILDEIKLIRWVVVCVTAFWCILVIAQLHNVFDLQPAPNIYAVWYFLIKIRPFISPPAIKCTIASYYHPVTDNNIMKLD